MRSSHKNRPRVDIHDKYATTGTLTRAMWCHFRVLEMFAKSFRRLNFVCKLSKTTYRSYSDQSIVEISVWVKFYNIVLWAFSIDYQLQSCPMKTWNTANISRMNHILLHRACIPAFIHSCVLLTLNHKSIIKVTSQQIFPFCYFVWACRACHTLEWNYDHVHPVWVPASLIPSSR